MRGVSGKRRVSSYRKGGKVVSRRFRKARTSKLGRLSSRRAQWRQAHRGPGPCSVNSRRCDLGTKWRLVEAAPVLTLYVAAAQLRMMSQPTRASGATTPRANDSADWVMRASCLSMHNSSVQGWPLCAASHFGSTSGAARHRARLPTCSRWNLKCIRVPRGGLDVLGFPSAGPGLADRCTYHHLRPSPVASDARSEDGHRLG